MAKVTLKVKKSKLKELMEYLNQLDYVTIEEPAPGVYESVTESKTDDIIPEWHKKIVLKRLATAKPESYISLTEAKRRIRKVASK